jgi:hypothetical protein
MRKLNGEQAVYQNLRPPVIMGEKNDDLRKFFYEIISVHDKVVGTYHDHHELGCTVVRFQGRNRLQQIMSGRSRNAAVANAEIGYTLLPVKTGDERIPKQQEGRDSICGDGGCNRHVL